MPADALAPTTDPTELPRTAAYRRREGSPCLDRGLDLKALYRVDPGSRDVFGNPIPAGAAFDIGPHEYRPSGARAARRPPGGSSW